MCTIWIEIKKSVLTIMWSCSNFTILILISLQIRDWLDWARRSCLWDTRWVPEGEYTLVIWDLKRVSTLKLWPLMRVIHLWAHIRVLLDLINSMYKIIDWSSRGQIYSLKRSFQLNSKSWILIKLGSLLFIFTDMAIIGETN